MAFLENQAIQFVIVAILAIIAIVVTIIIYRKQKQQKRISYSILSKASLLSVEEEIKEDLKILYKGNTVNQVQLIILRIFCSGNIPIRYEDFDTPITINLGNATQILSAQILKKIPDDQQISIGVEDNKVVVQPYLLNQGDSIAIKILATNFGQQIKIDGRIAGVKKIEESSEESKASNILNIIALLMIGLFAGASTFSMIFISPPARIVLNNFLTIFGIFGMGSLLIGYYLDNRRRNKIQKTVELWQR